MACPCWPAPTAAAQLCLYRKRPTFEEGYQLIKVLLDCVGVSLEPLLLLRLLFHCPDEAENLLHQLRFALVLVCQLDAQV